MEGKPNTSPFGKGGYWGILEVFYRAFTIAAVLVIFTIFAFAEKEEKMNGIEIFVSTDGKDSWSGRIEKPNPAGTDGPLATLKKVQEAIRILKRDGKLNSPATVYLRGGTYFLKEPLIFKPEESGNRDCPVTYKSYGEEKAVISGGKTIQNWKKEGRVWVAEIPEVKEGRWHFRQLFVNGERRYRTRLPKKDFFRIAELQEVEDKNNYHTPMDSFIFKEGDMKSVWTNVSDIEVVVFHFWVDTHMRVKSIDEATGKVEFTNKSRRKFTDDFNNIGARYLVENVYEALSEPGEWYLDRKSGKLYYIPKQGEDMEKAEVIAPCLSYLVWYEGDYKNRRYVEYVNFEDVIFSHNEWALPEGDAGDYQSAVTVPGAISGTGMRNCAIKNCVIKNIGSYGIELSYGCSENRIEGNEITDAGAGGIKVSAGMKGNAEIKEYELTGKTIIKNNHVHKLGRIYTSAVGVWIGHSGDNIVAHNHIHDLYYTGISVGWVWGYTNSVSKKNIIEFNHIHDVGQWMLSDMGGIYTLGISDGTVLRNNLIHDVYSWGYGGWGIYTDEGSTNILIENNVVFRTKSAGFHQHYGKENIVRNNIFAFGKEHQLMRSRLEPHVSFIFENNIIYWDEGDLLGTNWSDFKYKMDKNVYFDARGGEIKFAGMSFEEWKKNGMDANSIIANPMFVNPKENDFTLKEESPALQLGFKQIDVSKAGVEK